MALTLVLVLSVVGLVFFSVLILKLTDSFNIDRFLAIVGALSAFGWFIGLVSRLLRNWLRDAE